MLKAKKSYRFEKLFAFYNRNLLKRKFAALKVSNAQSLKQLNQNQPLIIYANHSSWWDGLVAFQISHFAKLDSYIMMEEKNLRRFFLFRRLGAFSVAREKPREALKSIEYSIDLLRKRPVKTLWIFPQGEILPNDRRPIIFYNGISKIASKIENCSILPLAFRYEFTNEFKPEIFVKIGKAENTKTTTKYEIKKQADRYAADITSLLDELKSDIINGNLESYINLI